MKTLIKYLAVATVSATVFYTASIIRSEQKVNNDVEPASAEQCMSADSAEDYISLYKKGWISKKSVESLVRNKDYHIGMSLCAITALKGTPDNVQNSNYGNHISSTFIYGSDYYNFSNDKLSSVHKW